jgi:hypothetical protein
MGMITITIQGGETFTGTIGLGAPNSGPGMVFTICDAATLYADTATFQYVGMPSYLAVSFYDAGGNGLGVFVGPAAGLPGITGDGQGSWS